MSINWKDINTKTSYYIFLCAQFLTATLSYKLFVSPHIRFHTFFHQWHIYILQVHLNTEDICNILCCHFLWCMLSCRNIFCLYKDLWNIYELLLLNANKVGEHNIRRNVQREKNKGIRKRMEKRNNKKTRTQKRKGVRLLRWKLQTVK